MEIPRGGSQGEMFFLLYFTLCVRLLCLDACLCITCIHTAWGGQNQAVELLK